ncbi:MAG: terminase large subunit [Betaproteobacteria bacterium]|nr:terminase large subunit [Betaproteobacteria bacterium]
MTTASQGRDYIKIALAYARKAARDTAGKRHCRWVRLACQRQLDDLARAKRDSSWPFRFGKWYAADVCDFVEKLPHVEGEWQSPTLVLEPWQVFILTTLYGWRHRETGARRFNTAYIECGRKNGKSPLASGLALYGLCCEGEPGPQVKCAATTGDQAEIVFGVAKRMAERTPALCAAFGVEVWAHAISSTVNGGNIRPINAKASTQDGLNPHMTIIDELHAHKDRALFDVLRSARGARKNPLSLYVTTAGYHLESVCMEQRTFLTKVLEGVLDADNYFGIIYTLDLADVSQGIAAGDDPFDEDVWIKANPNLGVSCDPKVLREEAVEARVNPAAEGEYKTKRMNLWLNAANGWLNMEAWNRCTDRDLRLEQFEGQRAWLGADLADRDDLTALFLLFERGEELVGFPWFFIARECIAERAKKIAHYYAWEKAGLLTITEGNITDYDLIERHIRALWKRFDVQGAQFDQYGSAHIASRLMTDGLTAVIEGKNAKNVTDPALDLEARVKGRLFRHDGNPVLRWMASNAVVTRKVDGSILPKKATANSPHKIDGIDALIAANALRMRGGAAPAPTLTWA